MKRRDLLITGAIVLFGAGVLDTVLSLTPSLSSSSNYQPLTSHYGNKPIAYEHDQLRLQVLKETVHLDGAIKFEITNTSESVISLGCHNPWTIQQFVNGQWRDVVWTSAEGFPTCATVLSAGESRVERVTISKAALETQTEEVRLDLAPGRYRFVLLPTDPFCSGRLPCSYVEVSSGRPDIARIEGRALDPWQREVVDLVLS